MAAAPALLSLMSADEMNKTLYPAFLHLAKHLRIPELTGDVLYLPLSSLLHGYYLYHYGSSLSEHYWSLSRTYHTAAKTPPSPQTLSSETLAPSATPPPGRLVRVVQLLGWLDTIFTPFLAHKLQQLHSDNFHSTDTLSRSRELFVRFYPYFNLCLTLGNTACKLAYFLRYTDNFSMLGTLLGIRYTTASSLTHNSKSIIRTLVEAAFPFAMFYVQFMRQWSGVEVPVYEVHIKPPPPHSAKAQRDKCPICGERFRIASAVSTTGIVYCYVCIFQYIQTNNMCPVSKIPVDTSSIIKLNIC